MDQLVYFRSIPGNQGYRFRQNPELHLPVFLQKPAVLWKHLQRKVGIDGKIISMFNITVFVPSLFANTEDTVPGNTDFALVPEGTEILIPLFSS
jgi:hypothetical protein